MPAPRIAAALAVAALAAAALAPARCLAIDASDRYRSPRNPERKIRRTTELIVLHTTEAEEVGSLKKLCDRGEAHYCVSEAGRVYRIVDRDREAFHAGRSMWNGKENVDKFSIGIECVGHHDKAMPAAQIAAIRTLVKELQSMYRLSDDRVVCHSHVAYGAPNKWHRQKHRGRKRCGMLFAMPSVRAQLGLRSRPAQDADVRAKRLVVGDEYLKNVLYGGVDTMRGVYTGTAVAAKAEPEEEEESGGFFSRLFRRRKAKPAQAASASKPVVAASKPSPKPTVAASKSAAKPASPKPAAAPKRAAAISGPPRTIAELKARGYEIKGKVSASITASKIAGGKWNSADTYYTIRNKVISGRDIDPARIEKGMLVWMKR